MDINIAVIGHVDAGKSTLIGHLLCLLGKVDGHELDKIARETKKETDTVCTQQYSALLDQFEEERRRGKTHEYCKISLEYNQRKYTIIDTPGHQQFVRSMISGISQEVHYAIVVVSMVENEFNASFTGGMLKEHLRLAKSAGITHFLIVANKMDLISWNKEQTSKQILQVKKYLVDELNIPVENSKFCFVDAYSGKGLIELPAVDWLKNRPLLEMLEFFPQTDYILKATDKNIIKTNILKLNAFIYALPPKEIILPEYLCVLHYDGKEIEVIVNTIDSVVGTIKDVLKGDISSQKPSPFIRAGHVGIITFRLLDKKDIIEITSSTKFIIRKDDFTIGNGVPC